MNPTAPSAFTSLNRTEATGLSKSDQRQTRMKCTAKKPADANATKRRSAPAIARNTLSSGAPRRLNQTNRPLSAMPMRSCRPRGIRKPTPARPAGRAPGSPR